MHHVLQDREIHNIEAYETKYNTVQHFGIVIFFYLYMKGSDVKACDIFKEKKKAQKNNLFEI